MNNLLNENESYNIIGACMEVHKQLGHGFLESVYQEALELELISRNIPFNREVKLDIYYKEHTLQQYYMADFICYDKFILELKATTDLSSSHISQVLNYLNATDISVGLLINFGQLSLQYKRLKV